MSSVEITIGRDWKNDLRFLTSLRNRRPAETRINLLDIRDIIDIVIDGTNLTASIPEEAIFHLIASLLVALQDLKEGTSPKGIIEFPHEPWELVLIPRGKHLAISLYSIDRRQKVIARDLLVRTDRFVKALTAVAEEMLTDLFDLSERFSADHQIRAISQALATLPRGNWSPHPPRPSALPSDTHEYLGSTANGSPLTLSYRFNGNDRGLRNYRGEHLFDLHALLFRGVVEAEIDDQSVILSRSYPFFAISSLLGRVRQLLHFGEQRQDFKLTDALSHLNIQVQATGHVWELELFDLDRDRHVRVKLAPADCLDSLLSLAEVFAASILQANSHFLVNQRFLDFQEELDTLRVWYLDLFGANIYQERPEDCLLELEPLRVDAPSTRDPSPFRWPIASLRAFFPRSRWTFRGHNIARDSLAITAHGVLITTDQGVHCLDPRHGTLRWESSPHPPPQGRSKLSSALAGESVLIHTGEELLRYHLQDGTCRERHPLHIAPLTTAISVDQGSSFLVSTRRGELFALQGSAPRMLVSPGEAGSHHSFLFEGTLACLQTKEGVIRALNPRTAEVLWKVRINGKPESPLMAHQGRLYTITHDPLYQGSTLSSIFPFTGRTAWARRLQGFLVAPPAFVDRHMLALLEHHDQLVLVGIDLEADDPGPRWHLALSSAGLDRPTAVRSFLHRGRRCGVLRTDRAELTAFFIDTGEILWQLPPDEETLFLSRNPELLIVNDTLAILSERLELRDLATGELLQSASLREAPESVHFLPPFGFLLRYPSAEQGEADFLEALFVDHFLAEIP